MQFSKFSMQCPLRPHLFFTLWLNTFVYNCSRTLRQLKQLWCNKVVCSYNLHMMIQQSRKNAQIGENIFSMLAEIFINIIQVSCVLYILTRLVSEKVKTVFHVGGQRWRISLGRCCLTSLYSPCQQCCLYGTVNEFNR